MDKELNDLLDFSAVSDEKAHKPSALGLTGGDLWGLRGGRSPKI